MKKFLVIGNNNCIGHSYMFPHIKSREVFVSTLTGTLEQGGYFITENGMKKMPSLWYTNLDSRHLYKTRQITVDYDPARYPKYDNYDAIEVNRVSNIPDYNGLMGVPMSIAMFSPEQFEIVDILAPYVDGKPLYKRIIVKLVRNEQDKQRQST